MGHVPTDDRNNDCGACINYGIDYSNFGPGFNAQIAKAAMELMVRWTMEHVEGVNEIEAYTLLHECLNSVHLVSNTLYQQKCGSPSGAPITVVINTLVNILYIRSLGDVGRK